MWLMISSLTAREGKQSVYPDLLASLGKNSSAVDHAQKSQALDATTENLHMQLAMVSPCFNEKEITPDTNDPPKAP